MHNVINSNDSEGKEAISRPGMKWGYSTLLNSEENVNYEKNEKKVPDYIIITVHLGLKKQQ